MSKYFFLFMQCSISKCFIVTGRYRDPVGKNPLCCWKCKPCVGNTYTSKSNMKHCLNCHTGFWHNDMHTGCEPIQYHYVDFQQIWGIALVFMSVLGNVTLILTFFCFICYRNTPVIRASSRGLCYVLMIGTCLFFLLPLNVIGKPTKLRCKLTTYMTGVALAINIGNKLFHVSMFFFA